MKPSTVAPRTGIHALGTPLVFAGTAKTVRLGIQKNAQGLLD
jgi:hypothetical protein